jgi:transcriptional regulator with XRE-family HTH domain
MTVHKKPIAGLGPRLRECRRWCHLTQAALGAKAGVTGATINRYEKGHITIPIVRLRLLASALGLRVNDLLDPPGTPCRRSRVNNPESYVRCG